MHGNAKRPAQGRAPVGASFVHCDSSDHNLELAGLEHLGTIWMGQVCQRQVAKIGKIGQGMQASYMKTTFKIVCLAHVLLPQVSFITCVSSQALDCKKVTQL